MMNAFSYSPGSKGPSRIHVPTERTSSIATHDYPFVEAIMSTPTSEECPQEDLDIHDIFVEVCHRSGSSIFRVFFRPPNTPTIEHPAFVVMRTRKMSLQRVVHVRGEDRKLIKLVATWYVALTTIEAHLTLNITSLDRGLQSTQAGRRIMSKCFISLDQLKRISRSHVGSSRRQRTATPAISAPSRRSLRINELEINMQL